jgi:hypothetical protein
MFFATLSHLLIVSHERGSCDPAARIELGGGWPRREQLERLRAILA